MVLLVQVCFIATKTEMVSAISFDKDYVLGSWLSYQSDRDIKIGNLKLS